MTDLASLLVEYKTSFIGETLVPIPILLTKQPLLHWGFMVE